MNWKEWLFLDVITRLWKEARCKEHIYIFHRNVYGDEINCSPGRSIWKCSACGKIQYKRDLHKDENGELIPDPTTARMVAEIKEMLGRRRNVFSFDAETDGLWGQAFAIGAVVQNGLGEEITRFVGRLPDSAVTNEWVRENVLPTLSGVPVTHESYGELLADFAKFYLANKEGADVVVHMGYIVETKVLRDMHELGLIGEWDAPYPLFDVSGNLQAGGADPTSVDKFATEHGLSVGEFEGGTHNPLYDSAVTAAVYQHLVG